MVKEVGSASKIFRLGVRLPGNLCSSAARASMFQWVYLLYSSRSIVYRLYSVEEAVVNGFVGLVGALGMVSLVKGGVAPARWV